METAGRSSCRVGCCWILRHQSRRYRALPSSFGAARGFAGFALFSALRVVGGLSPGDEASAEAQAPATRRRACKMNPLDLLTLIRSCDQQIAALFEEMITISFAMIVAIYYFLNRAKFTLKAFAFLF